MESNFLVCMLRRSPLNNNDLIVFFSSFKMHKNNFFGRLSENLGLFNDVISNSIYLFVCWFLSSSATRLWPCANVLSAMRLTNELELQMDERFINVSCRVTAIRLLHSSPAARYLLSASRDALLQI